MIEPSYMFKVFTTESKKLLHLAWPIMGAQLLQVSMVFTDNLMVARLGPASLGSLAIAGTVFFLFIIVSMGVLSALSPMVSQAFGRGSYEEIGRLVRQGLRIGMGLSAITILIFYYSDFIFNLLGQDPELMPMARQYLVAVSWGIPAQVGYICLRQYTEGVGDTKPSIVIAGVGSLVNVLADYVLIYGKYGFPELGVKGAGYATSLVVWTMFLCLFAYVQFSDRYKKFGLWKGPFQADLQTMKRVLSIGFPVSCAMISEMGFFAASTITMGIIGKIQLAAHQIAINAASFFFMIPMGLSLATTIRIGHRVGAGDLIGARQTGKVAFVVTTLMQIFFAIIFIFFPDYIMHLYTDRTELLALAVSFVQLAGLFQIFDGLQIVGIAALRGLTDTRIPFWNTVLGFWLVGFPIGLLATFVWNVGAWGIWLGLLVGLAVSASLHLVRFYRLTKNFT